MPQTYTTHNGPLSTIPPTSSPGLLFLQRYIRAVDTIHQKPEPPLRAYFSPNAQFSINRGESVGADKIEEMLATREHILERFSHEDFGVRVWDLEGEDGTRTVFMETVSTSKMKKDGATREVPELNILELERAEEGRGVEGLWLVKGLTYMNA